MKRFKFAAFITILSSIGIVGFLWAKSPNSIDFAIHQPVETNEDNEKDSLFTLLNEVGTATTQYQIASSLSAENLQVFLISGKTALEEKNYVPLAKAMEQHMVMVKETSNVNELSIDNLSDKTIFIHSGDIVKGGKQDRTIAYDVIIPPHSQNVALKSFCVEHGRWQSRGNEDVDNFNSNENMLTSRDLKLAAKYENNQSKVWQTVSQDQERLNYNISKKNGYVVDVKANQSASSLQLTLENKDLEKAKLAMETQLRSILANSPNPIGFVYAINGNIYGADIYNNQQLFKELWPKIVESIAIEAISEENDSTYTVAKIKDAIQFIKAADLATQNGNSQKLNATTTLKIMKNDAGNIQFSTIDKTEKTWLHKNYMQIDTTKVLQIESRMNNNFNIQHQIRN